MGHKRKNDLDDLETCIGNSRRYLWGAMRLIDGEG